MKKSFTLFSAYDHIFRYTSITNRFKQLNVINLFVYTAMILCQLSISSIFQILPIPIFVSAFSLNMNFLLSQNQSPLVTHFLEESSLAILLILPDIYGISPPEILRLSLYMFINVNKKIPILFLAEILHYYFRYLFHLL